MGRDKAFVEIDGLSLAARTHAKLKAAKLFSRITFIAGHEAQFAIAAIDLGAPFIFDIYPQRGPLSGIHAALSEAKSKWIFVTACDYPFTTSEMVELLAARISHDYGAVVPEQPDGRLQPLFAFYRAESVRALVNDFVEKNSPAPPLRELVSRLSPRIVSPSEYSHLRDYRRIFHNLNTPDDIRELAAFDEM